MLKRKKEIKFGNTVIQITKTITGYVTEIKEIKDNKETIVFKRKYIPIFSEIYEITKRIVYFILPFEIEFTGDNIKLIFRKRWFSSFDKFTINAWTTIIKTIYSKERKCDTSKKV